MPLRSRDVRCLAAPGADVTAGGAALLDDVAIVTERDLGRPTTAVDGAVICGEPGDGVLASLPGGLDTGVLSRDWRKPPLLPVRTRQGSDSSVGRPVADVVVVHVVDMRRMRLGGKLLRSVFCNKTQSCVHACV